MNFALRTTSDAHQCKRLDVLAAKSSSTNHKSVDFSEFFLNFTPEYLNLIVVSAVCRSSVNFSLGYSFEDVIVKPLFERAVFTSEFDYFLRYNTSEECRLCANRTSRVNGSICDDVFINFLHGFCLL